MKKIILLTAAVLLIGCGSEHDSFVISDRGGASLDSQAGGSQGEELIGFNEVLDFVILDNCTACHGDYVSESVVKNNASKIINRINGFGPGTRMPLGGSKLDFELIEFFEEWVEQEKSRGEI